MYISEIRIHNIRCFDDITFEFENNGKPILWTTLLGDNATGKTALLRAIAIGLCDESSAAGLLRESVHGIIRDKEDDAFIEIKLADNKNPRKKFTIKTTIENKQSGKTTFENLRQEEIKPKEKFPWDKLFVCAYGIGRSVSGTGDIAGYSAINAVYNLFNYSEGLQNPELVLLRLKHNKEKLEKEARNKLGLILRLPKGGKAIHTEGEGIKIEGPSNSKLPLRDLADGYRTTFTWVTDMIGWAINHNPGIKKIESIQGIVLIDAIDEHLHPSWQRVIVSKLIEVFPKVQFIIATHSPLVAAGTADFEYAQVIGLELKENNKVEKNIIEKESIKGMRTDQVLRSEAFNLIATASPKSVSDITRYYELKSKKSLNKSQKSELSQLKTSIQKSYKFGDTKYEEEVEKAVIYTLEKMLKISPTDFHKLIVKEKLINIFKMQDKDEKD